MNARLTGCGTRPREAETVPLASMREGKAPEQLSKEVELIVADPLPLKDENPPVEKSENCELERWRVCSFASEAVVTNVHCRAAENKKSELSASYSPTGITIEVITPLFSSIFSRLKYGTAIHPHEDASTPTGTLIELESDLCVYSLLATYAAPSVLQPLEGARTK